MRSEEVRAYGLWQQQIPCACVGARRIFRRPDGFDSHTRTTLTENGFSGSVLEWISENIGYRPYGHAVHRFLRLLGGLCAAAELQCWYAPWIICNLRTLQNLLHLHRWTCNSRHAVLCLSRSFYTLTTCGADGHWFFVKCR